MLEPLKLDFRGHPLLPALTCFSSLEMHGGQLVDFRIWWVVALSLNSCVPVERLSCAIDLGEL